MVLIGADRRCARRRATRKVRIRAKAASRAAFRRISCCRWLKASLDMPTTTRPRSSPDWPSTSLAPSSSGSLARAMRWRWMVEWKMSIGAAFCNAPDNCSTYTRILSLPSRTSMKRTCGCRGWPAASAARRVAGDHAVFGGRRQLVGDQLAGMGQFLAQVLQAGVGEVGGEQQGQQQRRAQADRQHAGTDVPAVALAHGSSLRRGAGRGRRRWPGRYPGAGYLPIAEHLEMPWIEAEGPVPGRLAEQFVEGVQPVLLVAVAARQAAGLDEGCGGSEQRAVLGEQQALDALRVVQLFVVDAEQQVTIAEQELQRARVVVAAAAGDE